VNPTDRPVIAVFGASQSRPGDPEYLEGVECGRLLAEAGFAVATGGYSGAMEAVCRGAAEAGGPTIGVTAPAVFPGRVGANQWVHHEMPADDLVRRIALLTDLAAGYIALPGSIGTLAEMVVAWNLAFVAPLADKPFGPIATVGAVWKELVPLLTDKLNSVDTMITTCATVHDAVAHVVDALA
jgi:uncharacterized protein (TIGR00730 family)